MSSRDSGTVNQETRPGVSETEQDQGHVGKRLARRDEGGGEGEFGLVVINRGWLVFGEDIIARKNKLCRHDCVWV